MDLTVKMFYMFNKKINFELFIEMVEIDLLEVVYNKLIHSFVTFLNHISKPILRNFESKILGIKLILYFFDNLTLKGALEGEV